MEATPAIVVTPEWAAAVTTAGAAQEARTDGLISEIKVFAEWSRTAIAELIAELGPLRQRIGAVEAENSALHGKVAEQEKALVANYHAAELMAKEQSMVIRQLQTEVEKLRKGVRPGTAAVGGAATQAGAAVEATSTSPAAPSLAPAKAAPASSPTAPSPATEPVAAVAAKAGGAAAAPKPSGTMEDGEIAPEEVVKSKSALRRERQQQRKAEAGAAAAVPTGAAMGGVAAAAAKLALLKKEQERDECRAKQLASSPPFLRAALHRGFVAEDKRAAEMAKLEAVVASKSPQQVAQGKQQQQPPASKQQRASNEGGKQRTPAPKRCFGCRAVGHMKAACPTPDVCWNCNEPGHKKQACTKLGGTAQAAAAQRGRAAAPSQTVAANPPNREMEDMMARVADKVFHQLFLGGKGAVSYAAAAAASSTASTPTGSSSASAMPMSGSRSTAATGAAAVPPATGGNKRSRAEPPESAENAMDADGEEAAASSDDDAAPSLGGL